MKNFSKIILLGLAIVLSLQVSSYFINDKLLKVNEQAETVASAMLKASVAEKLREAEIIIEREVEEEVRKNKDASKEQKEVQPTDESKMDTPQTENQNEKPLIQMEKLEMKEPIEKKENTSKDKKEHEDEIENKSDKEFASKEDTDQNMDSDDTNKSTKDEADTKGKDSLNHTTSAISDKKQQKSKEELALDEEVKKEMAAFGESPIITYYTLPSEAEIETKTVSELTKEELAYYDEFLSTYYFLSGDYYCEIEQDETLRQKKELVNQLETYMNKSYETLNDLIEVMTTSDFEAVDGAYDVLVSSREELIENYEELVKNDLICQRIYDKILVYLDRFIHVVEYIKEMGGSVSDDSLFAYAFVMVSIQDKVYKEVPEIMELAVDAKSDINAVYLLGVKEVVLLKEEDAIKCLSEPGYVLDRYQK